jgi:hypothetical protein
MTTKWNIGIFACLVVAAFAGGAASHWLMTAAPAAAQEAGNPKIVRATSLFVVDEAGEKVRAVFNIDAQGAATLEVRDGQGRARCVMLADRAGGNPQLKLLDAAGKARISAAVGQDGRPELTVTGSRGQGGILATTDRGPAISLTDGAGRPRAQLALDAKGTPSLVMFNPDGKILWQAPTKPAAK